MHVLHRAQPTPLQSDPPSRVLSARMAHVVSYLILNNIRSRRDRSPQSRHPRAVGTRRTPVASTSTHVSVTGSRRSRDETGRHDSRAHDARVASRDGRVGRRTSAPAAKNCCDCSTVLIDFSENFRPCVPIAIPYSNTGDSSYCYSVQLQGSGACLACTLCQARRPGTAGVARTLVTP